MGVVLSSLYVLWEYRASCTILGSAAFEVCHATNILVRRQQVVLMSDINLSRAVTICNLSHRVAGNKIWKKGTQRGIETQGDSLEIITLSQTLSKALYMSCATV